MPTVCSSRNVLSLVNFEINIFLYSEKIFLIICYNDGADFASRGSYENIVCYP